MRYNSTYDHTMTTSTSNSELTVDHGDSVPIDDICGGDAPNDDDDTTVAASTIIPNFSFHSIAENEGDEENPLLQLVCDDKSYTTIAACSIHSANNEEDGEKSLLKLVCDAQSYTTYASTTSLQQQQYGNQNQNQNQNNQTTILPTRNKKDNSCTTCLFRSVSGLLLLLAVAVITITLQMSTAGSSTYEYDTNNLGEVDQLQRIQQGAFHGKNITTNTLYSLEPKSSEEDEEEESNEDEDER